MSTLFLGQPISLWLAVVAIVVTLLALDLGVLHRDAREIGVRERRWLSAGCIGVALLFGAFLVFTGNRMLRAGDEKPGLEKSALLRRVLRVTPQLHGQAFFVRQPAQPGGPPVLWATPLFLALCLVEFADLKVALALVLVFIGSKIFLVNIVGKIPPVISLSVTAALVAGGVIVSLWKTRGQPAQPVTPADGSRAAPEPSA